MKSYGTFKTTAQTPDNGVISGGYNGYSSPGASVPPAAIPLPIDKALPRGRYRRDLSPQDRSDRQRLQLLTAAAKVFAAKGFANSAVEDVVKAAGMSRATFYIHFQDKDDLLGELYDTGASAVIRGIRHAAQGVKDPVKKLEKAFETYIFMMTHGKDITRVVVNEVAAGGPRMLERRDRVHAEFMNMFRTLANEGSPGQKPAALPSDVALRAVIQGIEGVVFNYLWRGEADKLLSEGKPALFKFMVNALRS